MRFSRFFVLIVLLVAVTGFLYAGQRSGAASLTKLLEGNSRFAEGKQSPRDCSRERRQELTKGQNPFATVISCSDSRVPPEVIFDQALGDLFIIRVAGNVIDPVVLGSIEYGVQHLSTPLLIILGHDSCGAVQATLDAKGKTEGNIGTILKKIMPSVEAAQKVNKGRGETLSLAVRENVMNSYQEVMKSRIVRHLLREGKLQVVAAEYHLGTGKVETLAGSTPGEAHAQH